MGSRARVGAHEVLAAMTRAEKVRMLHQHAPAVDRLGLAAFRTGTEALHGAAWLGTATVFPQPVGLGATWDPDLLTEVGRAVGTEVRALHARDASVSLNVWAPVVNSLRHPRWGRNEEGYSEDPDLTADLATGFCRGLRGDHPDVWSTVPTLKHFLAYGSETDRATTSSHLPAQALREWELPAFTGPLRAGAVGAVMPSYNLVNGRPSHVSRELLDELRSWSPGPVSVVSDAQAPANLVDGERYFPDHVASHAAALLAGVDSFTQDGEDAGPTVQRVEAALAAGLLEDSDVDRAVLRVLQLRERTGELSGEDPYGTRPDEVDTPAHRALAREAAARGVVLLADDGGALPLRSPRRVAVVGPFADHAVHDWYSGTPPYLSTTAAALAERYPGADVRVASGADRVALRSTTHDRYLEVQDDGALVASAVVAGPATHLDVTDWGGGASTLRSVATGLLVSGASWVQAASATRIGGWVAQETYRVRSHDDGTVSLQHLGSGRWLRVQAGVRLLVADGTEATAERFSPHVVTAGTAAVAAACAGSDVVVVAVGDDPHVAGRETEDRPGLELPRSMRETWRTAVASGSPAVLVVVSGSPFAVGEEAASAAAVVWTSHAGQELGRGLVDVLSGDRAPSGRLAQTWWRREADAGDLFDHDVVGSGLTYRYQPAEPLYALGHGLSYAPVTHVALEVSTDVVEAPAPTSVHTPARALRGDGAPGRSPGPGVRVVVTVRNDGERDVDELVAVWVRSPDLPVRAPRRRLGAWARVLLAPGEVRRVALDLPLGLLAVWDVAATAPADDPATPATPGAFVVQPGRYVLTAGRSVADAAVSAALDVTGPPRRPRRVDRLPAHAFHRHAGAVTSDRTREAGSCVEVHPALERAETCYEALDLNGAEEVRLVVARRALPARGPSTAALDARPAGGGEHEWVPLVPAVEVPDGGPYVWRELSSAVLPGAPRGAVDLRLRLAGAARVAEIGMAV